MAGKTLINSAAYTITGGRTLVGGTAYSIATGKTLINGAAYTISFKPQTLPDLWRNASLKYVVGRDATTQNPTSLDLASAPDGVYYVYSGYWVYWSIAKIIKTGSTLTKTVLAYCNINYGIPWINGTKVWVGGDGMASAVSTFGALIAAFQFNGYSPSQVDALFQGKSLTGIKGANNSSTTMVWLSNTDLANKMIVVNHDYYMAVNLMNSSGNVGETLFSNCSANPSMLWRQNTMQYISITGTGYTPTRSGAFVSIQ